MNECDYGAQADEMIRDRIVFGTNSSKIRQKLIKVGKELTLDTTIQIAQSREYSQEQLKTMSSDVSYVKPRHSRKSSGHSTSHQTSSSYSTPNQHGALGCGTPHQTTQKPSHDKVKTDKSYGNCGSQHQPGSCPVKGKIVTSV